MNRTLAIVVFSFVAIMMVSSIVPVMAEPAEGGDHKDHPDNCISGKEKAREKSGQPIPIRCKVAVKK